MSTNDWYINNLGQKVTPNQPNRSDWDAGRRFAYEDVAERMGIFAVIYLQGAVSWAEDTLKHEQSDSIHREAIVEAFEKILEAELGKAIVLFRQSYHWAKKARGISECSE